MATVPSLTYFSGTKTGNDVWVYYNLSNAVLLKKKSSTGDINIPNCAGAEGCPAGSWNASILNTPGKAAFGAFPVNSPIHTAVVGEVAPTEAGVGTDLVCFPDWDENELLCYDQGFDETPGNPFRPIPRKYMQADHYVRTRADSTIRLDDLYVSNWEGLRAISGRRVTIVLVMMPQGGSDISEIIYYSNFLVMPSSMTYGADQNASITLSGEGSYAIKAIFAAPKP